LNKLPVKAILIIMHSKYFKKSLILLIIFLFIPGVSLALDNGLKKQGKSDYDQIQVFKNDFLNNKKISKESILNKIVEEEEYFLESKDFYENAKEDEKISADAVKMQQIADNVLRSMSKYKQSFDATEDPKIRENIRKEADNILNGANLDYYKILGLRPIDLYFKFFVALALLIFVSTVYFISSYFASKKLGMEVIMQLKLGVFRSSIITIFGPIISAAWYFLSYPGYNKFLFLIPTVLSAAYYGRSLFIFFGNLKDANYGADYSSYSQNRMVPGMKREDVKPEKPAEQPIKDGKIVVEKRQEMQDLRIEQTGEEKKQSINAEESNKKDEQDDDNSPKVTHSY